MFEHTKNFATGLYNSTRIRFGKASTGKKTIINRPRSNTPFSNYMLAGAAIGTGVGLVQAHYDENKGLLRDTETVAGAASAFAIAGAGLKYYLNRPKPLGLIHNKSTV